MLNWIFIFQNIWGTGWNSPSRIPEKAQFSSVTQSCPTLCNSMDCSTPGLPVHHQLQELVTSRCHTDNTPLQDFSRWVCRVGVCLNIYFVWQQYCYYNSALCLCEYMLYFEYLALDISVSFPMFCIQISVSYICIFL